MGLLKLMDEYYAYQRSGRQQLAEQRLALALQVPELRPDALVALGIAAVEQQRLSHAFIYLAEAYGSLAKRSDVAALLAHILLLKKQPQYACAFLSDSANPVRNEPAARLMRLRGLASSPDISTKQLQEQLPYVKSAEELAFLLSKLPRRAWGFVEYDPLSQELRGWAIDTNKPSRTITLTLDNGQKKVKWQATLASPLLAKSGNGGRLGGIRIRLPEHARIKVTFDDGAELIGSPVATLAPVAVLPESGSEGKATDPVVDVLIPVYKGKQSTLECIHSVIESRKKNRTVFNIVVLDDVSPDAELSSALQALAKQGHIELHRHPANLGFIRNMNQGMLLHPERDVVWLNSDARVCSNWLDRLHEAAYSERNVASATPFSNNGELMSFPESRVSHSMPDLAEQEMLDSLAANGPAGALEIDVGCGFCLFIKREALNDVGLLDELYLKRGYGEETDWCLRAKTKGWKHLGAHQVFVAHRGGVSFGAEKIQRVAYNNAVLRQRYPAAELTFERFCRIDPIKSYRDALQRARLGSLRQAIRNGSEPSQGWPVIQTAKEADLLAQYGQALPPFSMTYTNKGQQPLISLEANLGGLPLRLTYHLPGDEAQLVEDLRRLELPGLVFKQLETCPKALLALPHQLGVNYRIHCADNALLSPNRNAEWAAFAEGAEAVEIPYARLAEEYAVRYPCIKLASRKQSCSFIPTALPINGTLILIADELQERSIAEAWLKLTRALKRQGTDHLFLLNSDTPWSREFLACGNVAVLPLLPGFNRVEMLHAAGCQLALSLIHRPSCAWVAPQIAALAQLPLFAPKSLIAEEVGAYPLQRFGGVLKHLLPELLPDRFSHD